MLFPASCPVCGARGASPCPGCAAAVRPPPPGPVPGLPQCRCLVAYDACSRPIITAVKYRNSRASLRWLADGLVTLVDRPDGPGGSSVDLVTWCPTTPERRRQRGYDQAELLARAVARRLGRPCAALLRRRPGPHQTGRSRSERQGAVHFGATPRLVARPPLQVLLVDDVVTTGATMRAASAVLVRAGVEHIQAIAVARTP